MHFIGNKFYCICIAISIIISTRIKCFKKHRTNKNVYLIGTNCCFNILIFLITYIAQYLFIYFLLRSTTICSALKHLTFFLDIFLVEHWRQLVRVAVLRCVFAFCSRNAFFLYKKREIYS